jgi:hypothetical protein
MIGWLFKIIIGLNYHFPFSRIIHQLIEYLNKTQSYSNFYEIILLVRFIFRSIISWTFEKIYSSSHGSFDSSSKFTSP